MKSNSEIAMEISKDKEKYEFVKDVLLKIHYGKLKKKEKQIVQKYLKFLTGYPLSSNQVRLRSLRTQRPLNLTNPNILTTHRRQKKHEKVIFENFVKNLKASMTKAEQIPKKSPARIRETKNEFVKTGTKEMAW